MSIEIYFQLASGHYVCPTCQTSMIDMKKLWDYLDAQAVNIPVPKSYQNSNVNIFCNDCFKVTVSESNVCLLVPTFTSNVFFQQSSVKFHFVGLKCGFCGGYNTSQNMKKRTWTLSNSKGKHSGCANKLITLGFCLLFMMHAFRQSINISLIIIERE